MPPIYSSPSYPRMTRERKPKAPSSTAATDDPPASALASQLGGLALETQPPAKNRTVSASSTSGAWGAKRPSAGGGEAGPSSAPSTSVPPLTSASLAASALRDEPLPLPPPADEKTCSCCTLVIAGKVYYCSRCHLVTYCGKDCQASGRGV